ncbi:nucleoside/nucleotide kinase family protein [Pacificoceanicola onchidii]|uniref:nucleoside/nucleotide kinase family protein n=1 Tax=Pacificoceanicola onchidii TaxID=2562685 RepID=UPI001F0ECDFC|nr:nucleoside/nucleotide kinase family protein [Pacificoceanicola onchidii]
MTGAGIAEAAALQDQILAAPRKGRRRLVALAGPPASGKSTLAEELALRLTRAGCQAQVVPMDGFHLDNRILSARGMLERKGAPETFDVSGLTRLVGALAQEEQVFFPLFDRARDLAIAGAGLVGPACDTVVIEGNYLLHDAPGWRDLAAYWDFTIALEVPPEVLRKRLIARWLSYGLTQEQAVNRAQGNDLPNADTVSASLRFANVVLPFGI